MGSEKKRKVGNYADFLRAVRLIPPEALVYKGDDVAAVEEVIVGKNGGLFTKLKGHKYPYPGFPFHETVEAMDFVKRLIVMLSKILFPVIKKHPKLARKVLEIIPDALHPLIKKHLLKPKYYSRPVREVYRLFNILIEREKKPWLKEKWEKIRDLVCLILEFDNAYRFRFQDVLSEIRLEEIKPTEVEKYWFSLREDYDFGGKMKKEKLKKEHGKGKN